MRYNPIKERRLPDKSKLVFEFPKPTQGGEKFVVTLPFFENIKINERKRANYKRYDLMSRSSQLYTYTGAESRRFTLEFTMSFPHIMEEHGPQVYNDFRRFVDTEDNSFLQGLFFKGAASELRRSAGGLRSQSQAFSDNIKALSVIEGSDESGTDLLDGALDFLNAGATGALNAVRNITGREDIEPPIVPEKYNKLIDIVLYWTNIIRSSVSNNSKNPVFGPPIVRINHGVLFQDIPCICNNYSVAPVEEAGYDLDSLMPRRILYTMELEELRAGDFQEFDPANKVAKDNLVGWEGVVSSPHQSMDPGYEV